LCHFPFLRRDQITQAIRRIIAAKAVLIGFHPAEAGPIRIVLQREQTFDQSSAPLVNEETSGFHRRERWIEYVATLLMEGTFHGLYLASEAGGEVSWRDGFEELMQPLSGLQNCRTRDPGWRRRTGSVATLG
jgi:hypothetical protein